MNLLDYIGKVDREEELKIVNQEKKEDAFLNQKDSSTCLERAQTGLAIARVRGDKIRGLAIAYHRHDEHSEDRTQEILELEADLIAEDVEAAQKGDFWNP